MAVSELKCIVAFLFVCCGQVTNTKKKNSLVHIPCKITQLGILC